MKVSDTRNNQSTRPSTQDARNAESQEHRKTQALRGLSYDEQVAALQPGTADAGAKDDPNAVVGPKDVPGVLYSNTSKTNLNKESDWVSRLDFQLGTEYVAEVTLDDLILAGHRVKAPPAAPSGRVTVPGGANTRDAREYDYIHSPGGSVVEQGATRFLLRGGDGGVGGPVKLTFANNGGLNLARLARAAYELAKAKGVTLQGNRIDYRGQTFALSCAVQMGNEVEADKARAYGYVGEFELKWISEKVSATVEALCASLVVAAGKGMQTERGSDRGMLHPYYAVAKMYQTPAHDEVDGTRRRKQGVAPIQSDEFKHRTVQSWGMGSDKRAWLKDPAEIAGRTQRRLEGSWAPGGDWRGHPTYITQCPDFTGLLGETYEACMGAYVEPKGMAKEIFQAIATIAAELLKAPMNHELIKDPDLQQRILTANRTVIRTAFAGVSLAQIKQQLSELRNPQKPPIHKPSDKPVEGTAPNEEGMVVLRDWSSRDR